MATHPLDARLPDAPEVSILTGASPFPENERDFDKWRQGVQARNIACMAATSEGGVCRTGDRFDPGDVTMSDFFPLVTYLPNGCNGFVGDPDILRAEAEASLRARLPYAVARELWTGALTGSASLQAAASGHVSSSTNLTPKAGIAAALADYEECTQGADAVIHVPSVLIESLSAAGFFERVGGRLVTKVGNTIIPGPGYPNSAGNWGPLTDLNDPNSGAANATGKVWVFVSPPVEVAPVHYEQTVETGKVRHNSYLAVAEAWTIARVDTCCVFASRVTIPDAD